MNIIINDININYLVKGEGKNKILLLHGWGSNVTLFNNIIDNLSKSYTVYALDLPGFGKSSEPQCSWNVDNYVEFVIDFIKYMKIDELSLLGHSFGGRIIIKMSTRDNLTFKISKIILIDSAGILPKKNKAQTIKTRIYKLFKKILSNSIIKRFCPNALEILKKKFGSEDYKNATKTMRETLVKIVNEDLEQLLNKIKQPTLLIWGENDTATPIEDAKIMEKLIKDSGLVVVKNAGHYSFLEQPFFVNKVLDSFLISKEKN